MISSNWHSIAPAHGLPVSCPFSLSLTVGGGGRANSPAMFLPIRDHNSRLTGHDVSDSVECPDWSNVRFPFVFGFRCVATGIDSTDLFLFPSLVSTDSIPLADGQKQIKLMTKTIILMKPEILPRTYCYLSLSLSFYLFIFIHFSPFSSYFLVFFSCVRLMNYQLSMIPTPVSFHLRLPVLVNWKRVVECRAIVMSRANESTRGERPQTTYLYLNMHGMEKFLSLSSLASNRNLGDPVDCILDTTLDPPLGVAAVTAASQDDKAHTRTHKGGLRLRSRWWPGKFWYLPWHGAPSHSSLSEERQKSFLFLLLCFLNSLVTAWVMMIPAATASLLLDGATEPRHGRRRREKKNERDTDGGGESFNQIWPPSLSRHHSWMTSCGLWFSFFFSACISSSSPLTSKLNNDGEGDETTVEFKVRALLLSWTTLPANNETRIDSIAFPESPGLNPTGTLLSTVAGWLTVPNCTAHVCLLIDDSPIV